MGCLSVLLRLWVCRLINHLSLCDARPMITFPAAGHCCCSTGTKLYCLATESSVWTTCSSSDMAGSRTNDLLHCALWYTCISISFSILRLLGLLVGWQEWRPVLLILKDWCWNWRRKETRRSQGVTWVHVEMPLNGSGGGGGVAQFYL